MISSKIFQRIYSPLVFRSNLYAVRFIIRAIAQARKSFTFYCRRAADEKKRAAKHRNQPIFRNVRATLLIAAAALNVHLCFR